ncbi:hypothetical protein B296_00000845 [Ensete ventricosum]|uniref:Uncharacterized protein n=1 Tax=Ensete ventricosum TaxID=4639 RepID=A0A427AN77_ENSVE|nr:hypothetical protein B296_00000845 [Ensete ventricosum]
MRCGARRAQPCITRLGLRLLGLGVRIGLYDDPVFSDTPRHHTHKQPQHGAMVDPGPSHETQQIAYGRRQTVGPIANDDGVVTFDALLEPPDTTSPLLSFLGE